ncbi:ciliary microtubule inner protein 4 isoform X2 [Pseudophryne corroboree]|uniref:ciliary microtubule inner protein 4 isoform X2 n=1 Tax=Pseudophryne corroboree TaxID=495146 RepID=UPI00308164C4
MDTTKWNNADPYSRGNKSRNGETMSNRTNISQEPLENIQEEIRSLVPANIRHKYGSSMVSKLISPEQVRSCLKEQEGTRYAQNYHIPRFGMKSGTREDCPYKAYYELGQCLRSNIFPGVPIKQQSLMQDCYTAEVNEKGILDKHNKHHWHGKKTDDLGRWHARNFIYMDLKKALGQKSGKA